jgi:hypothetical protein
VESLYLKEIALKSVKYYENNWLSPEFTEHTTRESVIDCSGYFYAYALKLTQNFFQKTRDEAEQSIAHLLTMTDNSLTESVKMAMIDDYNSLYLYLLDKFKIGLDQGEESMEGFQIMLDSCAKIITSSMYWLENN